MIFLGLDLKHYTWLASCFNKHLPEIMREAHDTWQAISLHARSNQERATLIYKFNEKWKKYCELTVEIKSASEGFCWIELKLTLSQSLEIEYPDILCAGANTHANYFTDEVSLEALTKSTAPEEAEGMISTTKLAAGVAALATAWGLFAAFNNSPGNNSADYLTNITRV